MLKINTFATLAALTVAALTVSGPAGAADKAAPRAPPPPAQVVPQARINTAVVPTDHCIESWSDAAPIVRSEALVAVRDVHEQVRQRRIGDLVKATLCQEGGRYVYRLVVRETSGRITPLTVDARKPF